ncbi:DMT family transporter [Candidatus Micrarchaeota archaeon]|nr:DMT family transporter [Candidatus Micrarchaeota archaeon]
MLDFLAFGLLAALGWGTGDFLNARGARKSNVQNAWIWSFSILSLLWLVFGLAFGGFPPLSIVDLMLALAVGLLLSIGDFLFITAAKSGKIAVASPLFSLSAVMAMGLGLLVLGERPGLFQLFLAALALCGGVLIGVKDLKFRRLEDAALGLLPAIVVHGIGLTLAKVLVDYLGGVSATVWFETLMR